jgi:two-component system, sensor histidine kinase LadS
VFCGSAHAQLVSLRSANLELSSLDVLQNVPKALPIEQIVSGQAGQFVPHQHLQIENRLWYRSVWLRLEIKAGALTSANEQKALLFIPKPYIDAVRYYTPSESKTNTWVRQSAGDQIAPTQWPMRSFHPQFFLPSADLVRAQPQQRMVMYLEIDQDVPSVFELHLADANTTHNKDLLKLVIYSICYGMIALAAAITAAMALFHRDQIYAWYSAYAASAMLACVSHSGVAHHVLWPVNGLWPGTAVLVFLLMCIACQLQFCRSVATTTQARGYLEWLTHLLSVISFGVAVLYALIPSFWETWYFCTLACVAAAMVMGVVLMARGWRAGNRLARAWLIAFVPLFLTVMFSILEGIGILSADDDSFSYVIYGATLEVLILGLALQWFARERHGERARTKTLASVDPLTGFATKQAFQAQLERDLQVPGGADRDVAVAYVELITQAASSAATEKLLKRSIRILRTATHAHDMVARLDGQLMAVLMPHVKLGDDLNQRLSRIIALGLMPDPSNPDANVLQFRIAATTRSSFKLPLDQIDIQLRQLLAQSEGWSRKPIRFLNYGGLSHNFESTATTSAFSDFWDNALSSQK